MSSAIARSRLHFGLGGIKERRIVFRISGSVETRPRALGHPCKRGKYLTFVMRTRSTQAQTAQTLYCSRVNTATFQSLDSHPQLGSRLLRKRKKEKMSWIWNPDGDAPKPPPGDNMVQDPSDPNRRVTKKPANQPFLAYVVITCFFFCKIPLRAHAL